MTLATGKSRSRGFTLFELLITLAIIALFSGFFVLRFDDGATEDALTKAATDLKRIIAFLQGSSWNCCHQDRPNGHASPVTSGPSGARD